MSHFISLHLPRLIDTLFTNLLIINITAAYTEGIQSSDDEKLIIFGIYIAFYEEHSVLT